MSAGAGLMRRGWPRLPGVAAPWRSPLARHILGTVLAAAAVAFAVAALTLATALPTPDATLWLRVGAAATLSLAIALAVGALLARRIAGPLAELRRLAEADWQRHGNGAAQPGSGATQDEFERLASAVRRLVAGLADRVAAHEEFAADIAHEIRNPLASLRSAAEALRHADDARRARLVEIIGQDVTRLDRLVGEISSASRLDAELVRDRAAEFDLGATLRGLVAHLSRDATARGIDVVTDLPAAPVRLTGLEERLAQVINNLFGNAASFCEGGDAIRVWARRRGDRILIAVEDTGPGIPDGEAERIFRRFYTSRPEGHAGHSGLGLAISRQIVEAHGGKIWAENIRPTESDLLSEPLGARFVVVLPL